MNVEAILLCLVLIVILVVVMRSAPEKLRSGGAAPTFTIYYSNECKYCRLALELLRKKRANFRAVEIDDFGALLKKLGAQVPQTHRTKPIIFKDGKFLGGYTDLAKYYGE